MSTVYLVVPCYNEEQVLPETGKRLIEKMEELVNLGQMCIRDRDVERASWVREQLAKTET